ncbi:hypothetical protein SPLC1_S040520 [Arthrospira platensis C1]|nr:hypothetical protein SPLC1_S040520 [Arthrospira platensis C1]
MGDNPSGKRLIKNRGLTAEIKKPGFSVAVGCVT